MFFLALAVAAGAACLSTIEPPESGGLVGGVLPGVEWSAELSQGSGITALVVGPDGALYAAGWTTDAVGAGTGAGGRDAFVRRYGPDGEVEWTRQFGAAGDDNAEDLAIDAAGNVYVVARVDGPVGSHPSGGRDGFVVAYDPDGNELWSLRIGTADVDWADSVVVAPDGGVFVSGSTNGNFPGFTNRGSTDNFLARIGPGGGLTFIVQFGSEEGMGATALAASEDRIYMSGSTLGPLSANPTGDEHAGDSDIFLRAFDLDGAEVWTRTFGSNNSDTALDVAIGGTAGGARLFVVGTTRARLPDPTGGLGNREGGFLDAFVLGMSLDGEMVWVRQFGTDEWDIASGLSIGPDGTMLITGRTDGAFPGNSPAGRFDIFVRAYDTGGEALWTRQMGSPAEDFAYAVVVGAGGDIFVAGSGGLGGDGTAVERGWVIRMAAPAK